MTTQTKTQSPGECPIKTTPRVEVNNIVPLPDMVRYFRSELRMSKRDAQWMAREAYRDKGTAKANLPESWFVDIWPDDVTFIRRAPGVSDPTPAQAFKNMEMAL